MGFARRPGESVNSVLARYEVTRQRAALEGQTVIPFEAQMLQVFRFLGTSSHQVAQLLQPIGGQMPTNEQDFNAVCMTIRRYGHITENAPNNIAQALNGPMRPARPGAYHADTQPSAGSQPASNTMGAYPVQQWAHGDPIVHDPNSSLPPLWDAPTQNTYYDTHGDIGPPQVQQGTWYGHGPPTNSYQ